MTHTASCGAWRTRAGTLARSALLFTIALAGATSVSAQTLLLRRPTISAQHIAFEYGGDLWVTGRDGGDARRLTSFQGQETLPAFSPNGRWIAFSAQYGGNTDVYLLPVEGGEPRRLTWHPGADLVQGWTPDGNRIVFASGRTNAPSGQKFWTVSLDASFPEELPMPRAHEGKFSADGARFAYRMVSPWEDEWRNYRGGQNRPIWILDMKSHDLEEVKPWDGSNDQDPVWIGDVVYFLSDRDYAMNIYSYDTRAKQLRQLTQFSEYDVKNLDAGAGLLAFEQGGAIHTLDPRTGQTKKLTITVRGDFPWQMPHWEDVAARLTNAVLSPTGKRAVFEARGEIFTVPSGKGDWRNLTNSSGVADRTPSWSPDGKSIAWFSDARGEYRLMIGTQDGIGKPREIELPEPTFYFTPAWSPDSKKLLFTDTDLRLWVVDVASGRATKVDSDTYMVPERSMNPVWSPDSRWIAYTKRLPSQFHAISVYNVESGKVTQLTDGLSDATWPAWDASGKYMYFLASTNWGLNTGWLDMTSYERPVTRAVYLAVLKSTDPSPLLPESDEETAPSAAAARRPARAEGATSDTTPAPAQGSDAVRRSSVRVDIDADGFMQRIVSLELPPRDYSQLRAGVEGNVFFVEAVPASGVGGGPGGGGTLHRYQLRERRAAEFVARVATYTLSADGKKLLYRAGGGGGGGAPGGGGGQAPSWFIVDADRAAPRAGDGRLDVASIRMQVDPKGEWQQIFDDGWRFQRDFLYVTNLHGADYAQTKARYAPFVSHVAHRADLTYLLDWMGGEVAVGHSFVRGGDMPAVEQVNVGLLGADLVIANGRYRIAKIYSGENWNPELRAPLSGPGINVRQGDYILAVNGVELTAPSNPYRLFEGTANRQTVLRVASDANGANARNVTVVPVASESALRQRDWIEGNRRKVDQMSGGRLAYVYVPNTGTGGYTSFNRYYFAQQHKQGAVIDERFNSGGSAADYIVEVMRREMHGYFNNPVGDRTPFTSPAAGIWGPKVMIINEMAGSGGDLMPYMFRYYKVGPTIGKRTWGGLVGTWDTPQLLDGGTMIAPRGGFFDMSGNWAVENEGTPADIEVEMTPKDVIAGRDPQLERAVAEALRLLNANPVVLKKEPPPPIRARRPVTSTSSGR